MPVVEDEQEGPRLDEAGRVHEASLSDAERSKEGCRCESCCDIRERNARRRFIQPINPDPVTGMAKDRR